MKPTIKFLLVATSMTVLAACGGGGGGDSSSSTSNSVAYPITNNSTYIYQGGEKLSYELWYKSQYSQYFDQTTSQQGTTDYYIQSGFINGISGSVYRIVQNSFRDENSTFNTTYYNNYDSDKSFVTINSTDGNSLFVPGNIAISKTYTSPMTFTGDVTFNGNISYSVVEKVTNNYTIGRAEAYKIVYSGRLTNPNYGVVISIPNNLNQYADVSGELHVHPRIGVVLDSRYITTYSPGGSSYKKYFIGTELTSINWTMQ